MPFYEYRCEHCAHQLEKMQKMSDPPLTDCPACGQPALRRLISAVGFRLKGGGWYETDFKQGGKRNLHEDSSKAGAAGQSAKSAESPKKPAKSGAEKAAKLASPAGSKPPATPTGTSAG